MRRLACLGVILSAGLVAACSSDTNNGGTGGSGGAAGGSAGAAAGAPGHGGTGGNAGHAGGAGGQPAGGAAGSSPGGNGGQPSGGAGGQSAGGGAGHAPGGAGGQPAGGAGGQPAGGNGGQPAGGNGGQPSGGAGGQPAGGNGGQPAGGNGGQPSGGAGGGSVGGAGGSGGVACLDPSMYSAYFTIADSTFCAVALYTAPEGLNFQAPTWGSHGGPLVVQSAASGAAGSSGTGVTLERWTAPTGSTGTMTVQTTPVASVFPAGTFLGAQAVDLPFFGWTALSWVDAYPKVDGKFEMISGGAIATSYDVNGAFGVAAVPAASSLGRLLYSGLSPVGDLTTKANGLYAADACSSPANALGTGTGCSAPAAVATWGDTSGPVVADSNGDVFAVMNSFTGPQEARGFLASSVARGSTATAGVTLFTLAGYSGSLAAMSPTATAPGLVVFQSFDSSTNDALDVIEQKFTTGSSLAAMGTPTTLLTVASAQSLSFLVDGSNRLWAAASGTSSTTYVVLARR